MIETNITAQRFQQRIVLGGIILALVGGLGRIQQAPALPDKFRHGLLLSGSQLVGRDTFCVLGGSIQNQDINIIQKLRSNRLLVHGNLITKQTENLRELEHGAVDNANVFMCIVK